MSIRPVILCGGSGKRLWPLSRESYPKQFSHLVSQDETMLQATIRRLNEAGGERPVLLSANDYRFIVGEQLEQMGQSDRDLIIEPSARNTAPAICAAAIRIAQSNANSIMVISPADHQISNEEAFQDSMKKAVKAAEDGKIVTFGIVPDRAETGYGYIELSKKHSQIDDVVEFIKFTEKPDEKSAQKMVASEKFLWNSGIFVAKASTLIDAFKTHVPTPYEFVKTSVENGADDLDFFRLGDTFNKAQDISIDYAIMEKVKGFVVPLDCGWNDLGGWQTVWLESDRGQNGVAEIGNVTSQDCKDSLLRVEGDRIHMVGLGLDNIAAVAMGDAVLIADMNKTQDLSNIISKMRKDGIAQAHEFPRASRPWGTYETLMKRERFHVKEIIVKPSQILSLQSHVHRAEHWVVVAGTAKVTIDDKIEMLTENQSIYIPLGAIHRMENPGKMDLHIVEVQTGAYLEEDDIIRYEDVYARS